MPIGIVKRLGSWLEHQIWQRELGGAPAWRRFLVRAARLTAAVSRDLADGQLTLRAMSMVYTTLLSLVPLLAFSFSVLKGFGMHNRLEPWLLQFLSPLRPRGQEIGERIIGFVENVKAGVLGSVGLLLLLWTVISLIQKVEAGFNYVWRVRTSRNIIQRTTGYLSVLLIGPVLMVSAIGITASISSNTVVRHLLAIEGIGALMVMAGKLVPYLMVVTAFTVCYLFIPNTRVRPGAALLGGLVAGVLWETLGKAFAMLVAGSGRYEAIYSGFAIVLLAMFWLYISWLILLLGAQVAYYQQHPRMMLRHRLHVSLSSRVRERLALAAMGRIAAAWARGATPWSTNGLAAELGVAEESLDSLLTRLEEAGLLLAVEDGGWVPGRDPHDIRLADVLTAVRATHPDTDHPESSLRLDEPVSRLAEEAEQAMYARLAGRSLADLADRDPPSLAQQEEQ